MTAQTPPASSSSSHAYRVTVAPSFSSFKLPSAHPSLEGKGTVYPEEKIRVKHGDSERGKEREKDKDRHRHRQRDGDRDREREGKGKNNRQEPIDQDNDRQVTTQDRSSRSKPRNHRHHHRHSSPDRKRSRNEIPSTTPDDMTSSSHSRSERHRSHRSHRQEPSGSRPKRQRSRSPSPTPDHSLQSHGHDRTSKRSKGHLHCVPKPSQPAPLDSVEGIYNSDFRGDPLANKQRADPSQTPLYPRYTGDWVLGLGASQVRLGSHSKTSHDRPRLWKKPLHSHVRRIVSSASASNSDATSFREQFIPLATASKATVGPRFGKLDNILNEMNGGYQSDSGHSQSSSTSDQELDGQDPRQEQHKRIQTINARIKQDPSDVASWLELVSLQKLLVDLDDPQNPGARPKRSKSRSRFGLDQDRRTRESRKIALFNVQLSILDKAISSHPQNHSSLALLLARLKLVAKGGLWESEKLEKEWQKLFHPTATIQLQAPPSSQVQIWIEYLDWRQSDWLTFQIEKVETTFQEAISAFRSRLLNPALPVDDRIVYETALVRIVTKLVGMLKEAGYLQKAFAILQTLLILNVVHASSIEGATKAATPTECQSEFDHTLRTAGQTWNGQEQRPYESFATVTTPSNTVSSLLGSGTEPHSIDRWYDAETSRMQFRPLPARLKDLPIWSLEGDDIDPFSTILFGEVESFLFPIVSLQSKIVLLDLALSFAGLPLGLFSSVSAQLENDLDPSLASDSQLSSFDDLSQFWPSSLTDPNYSPPSSSQFIQGQMMQRERKSRLSDPSTCPLKQTPMSIESLFSYAIREGKPLVKDDGTVLVRALLQQMLSHFDPTAIHIVRLAVEYSVDPKAAVKMAKALLSQDRHNLVLWHAYAQAEAAMGKLDSAKKIYLTALDSCLTLPVKDQGSSSSSNHNLLMHLPALWMSAADVAWRMGNEDESKAILVLALGSQFSIPKTKNGLQDAVARQEKVYGIQVLQALRGFENATQLEFGTPLSKYHHLVVFCHALFEYLIQPVNQSLESAMAVFDRQVEQLRWRPNDKSTLGAVLMLQSQMILQHVALGRTYRPLAIRSILDKSLSLDPLNLALWSHLTAHEMRSKIDNHIRLSLQQTLKNISNNKGKPTGRLWLYAILLELHLYDSHFNEVAVRRLFGQACDSDAVDLAIVWKAYLEFETLLVEKRDSGREKKKQLERANSLVYRAIEACPASKFIYLHAFRKPLGQTLQLDQIRALYELMCEKQLRVYVDMDVFLDQLEVVQRGEEDTKDDEDEMAESDTSFDDPFDPNLPYVKRADKYEQIGGGGGDGDGDDWDANGSSSSSSVHRKTGFFDLPVELLHMIQLLSRSSSLPIVCRSMVELFRHVPTGIKARFLLETWYEAHLSALCQWRETWTGKKQKCPCKSTQQQHIAPDSEQSISVLDSTVIPPLLCPSVTGPGDPISFSARFPICTVDVLSRIAKLINTSNAFHDFRLLKFSIELPKRLFRNLSPLTTNPRKRRRSDSHNDDQEPNSTELYHLFLPPYFPPSSSIPNQSDLDLLFLLLSKFSANPTSHFGFPLAMSVHSQNWILVSILLAYNANPSAKDGLAIHIAIRQNWLPIIQFLVERNSSIQRNWNLVKQKVDLRFHYSVVYPFAQDTDIDNQNEFSDLQDRLVLSSCHLREAIRSNAWSVIPYLLETKHVIPDMKTLKLMDKKGF